MVIFFVSYIVLLIAAALFMHKEHGAYQGVKSQYDLLKAQNLDLLKKHMEVKQLVDQQRMEINALKAEMDDVQLHCAKLRSQQQLIDRDNAIIKRQIVPIQVDVKLPAGAVNGKPQTPIKEFSQKAKKLAKSAKSKGLM